MNIIKNRYIFFLISLIVIIPGLVFLGLNWKQDPVEGPIRLGIDFRGGSLLEIEFNGARPNASEITAIYNEVSTEAEPVKDPIIQPLGDNAYAIRSRAMNDETKSIIISKVEAFAGPVTVLNFTSVSASVGAEVTRAAGVAIFMAAAAILLYIWWAFRGVEHPMRYGAAAVLAMLHDVLVVLGVEAMFGYFLGWEADALFLTAMLTIIGFSVHDTIVVFDRVRENSRVYRRLDYETLVNHSIVQTLDRSLVTQLTVIFTLVALVLFGGDTIRHFVIILLIGIFSGTYSSIFNAAPFLVVWENREWENWFKRKKAAA